VTGCLDALAPEDLPILGETSPRIAARVAGVRWRWAAVALAGALAASLVLFFTNVRPRPEPAHPARKESDVLPVQAAARQPIPASVKRRAARVPRPKPRPELDDFVAFDDADPMQMGMVVRVMVPVSDASLTGGMQEIAADLMIGEDGRARAIRFVQ